MAIALETAAHFTAALDRAHDVALSSYMLHPGRVLDALVAAARRGAHVKVRIEGDPFESGGDALHRLNAASTAKLRAAGADVVLTAPAERSLHIKAAVVDGVAWFDGRNWGDGVNEVLVRDDDRADVDAVTHAVRGDAADASTPRLATTKAGALALELDVIEHAGTSELCVESESFGSGSIYAALLRRAEAHLPTRLIVAGREAGEARNAPERTCLAHLSAAGVDVRIGNPRHDLNDKIAIASAQAWTGSANATYAGGTWGTQSDWGLVSSDGSIVNGLREAFERNWTQAREVAPPSSN